MIVRITEDVGEGVQEETDSEAEDLSSEAEEGLWEEVEEE